VFGRECSWSTADPLVDVTVGGADDEGRPAIPLVRRGGAHGLSAKASAPVATASLLISVSWWRSPVSHRGPTPVLRPMVRGRY
jgi:hypothetical protein